MAFMTLVSVLHMSFPSFRAIINQQEQIERLLIVIKQIGTFPPICICIRSIERLSNNNKNMKFYLNQDKAHKIQPKGMNEPSRPITYNHADNGKGRRRARKNEPPFILSIP